MKVAVKNKSDIKYVDAEEVIIGERTLGSLLEEVEQAKAAVNHLIEELKGCIIVKKDQPYIVNIGRLERVPKLEIYEDTKSKLPLRFYKVENGELVLDKKKVGAL